MQENHQRFIGRREYFGSLIYDRQLGDYIPFDRDATQIFEKSTRQSLDALYQGMAQRLTRQAFDTFVELCRSIEIMDQDGRFTGTFLNNTVLPRYISAPTRVHLAVTYRCSLKCRHCYSNSGSPRPHELTAREINALVDQMAALGCFELSVGGGEPLEREEIFDILAHARLRGVKTSLSTSAVPVTQAVAKRLAEVDVKALRVSFDAASEKTYDYMRGEKAYRKAVRGIKNLLTLTKIPVSLHVVLTRNNLAEIPALVRAAEKFGVRSLIFDAVLPAGRARENPSLIPTPEEVDNAWRLIRRIREQTPLKVEIPYQVPGGSRKRIFEGFGCDCGHLLCHVDATGNVAGSGFLVGELPAGNIRQKGLQEIWASGSGLVALRSLEGNPTCRECSWFKGCRGGCRARSLLGAGVLQAPDPTCQVLLEQEHKEESLLHRK